MKHSIYKFMSLFTAMLFIVACEPTASIKLTQNYDREKIKSVMVDLYVAQAALKDVDESYMDSLRAVYTAKIEEIHQVDMELIQDDIASMQQQLTVYKKLHREVEDSIISIEKHYNKKKVIDISKTRLQ